MKFYTNVYMLGNDILVRGFNNGKRIKDRVKFKPTLYLPSTDGVFRTIDDRPLGPIRFDSIKDAREYVNKYKDVANFNIYGMTNYAYQYIYDNYTDTIKFDPNLIDVVSLDIEVAADEGFPDIQLAEKEITLITFKYRNDIFVFGCGDYQLSDTARAVQERFGVTVHYHRAKDEAGLIIAFLDKWDIIGPDVVTGWNVEFFDIPYMVNRFAKVVGLDMAKKLSPWRLLDRGTVNIGFREVETFTVIGITILDYLQLYKKFKFQQQESYKLDYISQLELGEGKLDYSEYDSLIDLYRKDFIKFTDYNIIDVIRPDQLDKKLGFINQVYTIAYDAKVNYQDTLTTVRMWDVILHNYLLSQRICVPQLKVQERERQIDGGYVKSPEIADLRWVVSFDLQSLYPHLIMQYNISPETFAHDVHVPCSVQSVLDGAFNDPDVRELMQTDNLAFAATGYAFRRDKMGFIPKMMERIFADRAKAKKEMLAAEQELETCTDPVRKEELEIIRSKADNFQMAKKIQLNSCYGALSNVYFRWYDIRLAESITRSGQLTTKWVEKKINTYVNKMLKTEGVDYVIACDTDSMYLNFGPLVERVLKNKTQIEIVHALDLFCKEKIQPMLDKWFQELAEYVNAFAQKMYMKREVIASKGIWTGKKHYILNVWNSEGVQYEAPKLKMKGIEAVKSSTPSVCRDKLKEAYKVLMNGTNEEMIEFIDQFRQEFYKMDFEDVAFPRGVNDLQKYEDKVEVFKKGCPIHVRGALLYNRAIVDAGISNRYQPIHNGDRIKFAYLRMPNPIRQNVIASPGNLPKQLGLDPYIDYEAQFEKSFLGPLRAFLDVVRWDTEHRTSLDEFFA